MHVMLDIETLGTKPGCVVMQVGMVTFNVNDGVDIRKVWNIDVGDQIAVGLVIDPDTADWWRKQVAVNQVLSPYHSRYRLYHALIGIDEFLREPLTDEQDKLWASPDWFDLPCLAALYHKCGREYPWPRRQTADARTLLALAKISRDSRTKSAHPHEAAFDAEAQAEDVIKAANKLGVDLR